ncbi:MAG: HEAT repeat domain-containing protein [Planctomycetes bacterium]|nr:HEAT repeat domain-containing protein [Planctomycetota bacterium]
MCAFDASTEDRCATCRRIQALEPAALDELLRALATTDVSDGAVRVAEIVPEAAFESLLVLLDDPSPDVRTAAVRTLDAISAWWSDGPDHERILRRLSRDLDHAPAAERAARLAAMASALGREGGRPAVSDVPAAVVDAVGSGVATAPADEVQLRADVLAGCGRAARRWAPALRVARWTGSIVQGRDGDAIARSLDDALCAIGPESPATAAELAAEAADVGCGPARRASILRWLESWREDAASAVPHLAAWAASGTDGSDHALDVIAAIPGAEEEFARLAIASCVRGRSPWHQYSAGLEGRWERAVPPLTAALRDGDAAHRAAAAEILGWAAETEHASLAPHVAACADDPNADVRLAASWAWPHLRSSDGQPVALRLLGDPDARVRRTAAAQLGDLRSDSRDAALAAAIAPLLVDPDVEVTLFAGTAIGEIGALPPGFSQFVGAGLRSAERSTRVGAVRAARALGPGARAVLPELLALLDDDLGSLAVDAIAAAGPPDDATRTRVRAWVQGATHRAAGTVSAFGDHAEFLADLVPTADRREARCRARALTVIERANGFGERSPPLHVEALSGWMLQDDTPPCDATLTVLRSLAADADARVARGSIALLEEFDAAGSVETFAAAARSERDDVRDAGVFALAAAARKGAALPADIAEITERGLRGTGERLAAALHLAARTLPIPARAVTAARDIAARATETGSACVAAADVLAAAGDRDAALATLRRELAVVPGSFGWMSPPGLTEADLPPAERTWCRVANVVLDMWGRTPHRSRRTSPGQRSGPGTRSHAFDSSPPCTRRACDPTRFSDSCGASRPAPSCGIHGRRNSGISSAERGAGSAGCVPWGPG